MFEIDERVVRPQLAPQFVAADDFAWPFEEPNQNPERLIGQSDPSACSQYLP